MIRVPSAWEILYIRITDAYLFQLNIHTKTSQAHRVRMVKMNLVISDLWKAVNIATVFLPIILTINNVSSLS